MIEISKPTGAETLALVACFRILPFFLLHLISLVACFRFLSLTSQI